MDVFESLSNPDRAIHSTSESKSVPNPPVLLTPADGSLTINTRPILSWEFSADVTAWHLQVSLNALFSTTIYEDTTIIKNSRQVGALPCNRTVFWRVRAKNQDGWSSYSNPYSFLTQAVPQHAAISIRSSFTSPGSRPSGLAWDGRNLWMVDNLRNLYKMDANGNVITSFPVLGFSDDRGLTWDGTGLWIVVGVHNYKMDTLGNVIDTLDVQHWWHSGLDWDGKYWWFGNYNSSTLHKHNRNGEELLNFDLNEIFGHPTGLAFDGINLWVGTSSEGFTDDIFKYSTMGAYIYEFDLGTLGISPPSGSYASLAWDGQSLWYATDDQFTIYRLNVPYYHQVPSVPSLLSPANGEVEVEITPILSWNESENAGTYELQVATDISFNDLAFDISDIPSTSHQLETLEKMTAYYWHVRATNPVGSSLYSEARYFTTAGFDPESDSLALVALYESTDGTHWTNHTNWLTGNISTWYGITVSADRVVNIDLHSNNLTGSIPNEIGDLKNLQDLLLYDNHLSGTIPSEIGNLLNLQNLGLFGNQLTGPIPPEIGDLIYLNELNLSSNQLTGNIPSQIWNLTNLLDLNLNYNNLTGTIQADIGDLTALQELELEWNQLSGTLPAELWDLTSLQTLKLTHNQFSGTIPSAIGNLVNLTDLIISNNYFAGAIPEEITNLTNLYWFYLNYNEFTDLPDLSPLTWLDELIINNNKFTFEDIEPNIGVPSTSFGYAPQDSVGIEQTLTVALDSTCTINIAVGGDNNLYQWYLNGISISGANGSTYTISNAEMADYGEYHCVITNTVATELALYSRPIRIISDKIIVTDGMPYLEEFEGSNEYWITGGTNCSWELGVPSGATINTPASGSNAWMTKLSSDHHPNETSWVKGPLFDLSLLSKPTIEMKVWWDSEGIYDGAAVQYSEDLEKTWHTLQKTTDYLWYNSSNVVGLLNTTGSGHGWSGDGTFGTGSNGWLTVRAPVAGPADYGAVTFRILFASNGVYENDGFAFDDVRIYNDATSGIEPPNENGRIRIYPNPFREKATIEFENPYNESFQLILTDLSGKIVRIVKNLTVHRIDLDRGNLFSGIYILELMGPRTYRGLIMIE